jgi:hypothetical protein
VLFLFGDPGILEEFEREFGPESATQKVTDLIERGQAEGVFDPTVTTAWIQNVLWALVYAGCDAVGKGRLPRHGAPANVIRAFESGLHAPGAGRQ